MPLSWSMDKIGPIARSIEDCALILGAIHGADELDLTAVTRPFEWPNQSEIAALRVGYFEGAEKEHPEAWHLLDQLGVQRVKVSLPKDFPVWESMAILTAEAATVFADLTKKGITEGLNTWPTEFRKGHLIPAVDYLKAQRIRSELMSAMDTFFEGIDVYLGGGGLSLGITNLTGHPTVVLPLGDREGVAHAQPGVITLTGKLFGESALLKVARAIEESANEVRRPHLDI